MLFLKSGENSVFNRGKFISLIVSTIIAYILSIILLFIFSIIITYTNINEKFSEYFVKATMYIASMSTGFISAGKIANKGWLSGLIAGACYSIILIIISAFINKCSFGFATFLQFLICMLTGMIGGITGINLKNK